MYKHYGTVDVYTMGPLMCTLWVRLCVHYGTAFAYKHYGTVDFYIMGPLLGTLWDLSLLHIPEPMRQVETP